MRSLTTFILGVVLATTVGVFAQPLTRAGTFINSLVIGTASPATPLTGSLYMTGVTQANLGTPTNGTFIYCSDCTIANPCAAAGSGALAKRLNGVWVCN